MVAPLIPIALSLAAEFAPQLIRHLAGDRAGDVADRIVGAAKVATGLDDPTAIAEKLRFDATIQAKFRIDMASLELEETRMFLADVQSARGRDVALAKAGRRNTRADVMILAAFAAVIAIAALLAMGKIDGNTAAGGFLIAVGGMFARNIGTAFDFEFGSSRSSKDKDAQISAFIKNGH